MFLPRSFRLQRSQVFHPLQFFGKRPGRSPVVAVATGAYHQQLFHLSDRLSGRRFLIDTGAAISVVPARHSDWRSDSRGLQLRAANGAPIRTFGKRSITLQFHDRRYTWQFIVADVDQPLLGADFLCHFELLVDVNHKRLLHMATLTSLPLTVAAISRPILASIATDGPFASLLAEFPAISTPTFSNAAVRHGVEHFIPTTGPPVHSKFRRLKPDKLTVAREEFAKLEALGIIRRSCSPWSSPLHMVSKNSGGWRPCGDFRRLNNVTTPDRYPIPHIQDCTSILAGTRVFSKVDLVRGYHQVPVHSADIPKTAVVTPFGLFEWLRMPFGLKNAAQVFQRLMDVVCRGLDFVFV